MSWLDVMALPRGSKFMLRLAAPVQSAGYPLNIVEGVMLVTALGTKPESIGAVTHT